MAGKYNVDDIAFLIESNRFIRKVKILRFSGGLYTIQFVNGGGGMKVRESRLFASKEEAEAAIPKPIPAPKTEQTPRHPTPWD